jgi:hypothetical protein
MSQADGSTCHQVKSLKAERGKAWWLLCHAPPSVGSASGQKLRLSSWVAYGRAPNRWHIELMLQVAWCATKMRTIPPHSSPSSAPRPPSNAKPIAAGSARPNANHRG